MAPPPPASGAGPTSMGPPPPPTSATSVTTRYVVLQTASPSRGSVVADSAQASRLIGKDIFDFDDVVIFFYFFINVTLPNQTWCQAC